MGDFLIAVFFCMAVVLVIYLVMKNEKRKAVRVRCESCSAVMTYGRWKKYDGCVQCGSDLFSVDLGEQGWKRGLTRL